MRRNNLRDELVFHTGAPNEGGLPLRGVARSRTVVRESNAGLF